MRDSARESLHIAATTAMNQVGQLAGWAFGALNPKPSTLNPKP